MHCSEFLCNFYPLAPDSLTWPLKCTGNMTIATGLMLERLCAIKKPFRFREALLEQQVWRYVAICWTLAWLPTIPLWFDSSIEDHWRNNTNCTCFFPLDNVRFITYEKPLNLSLPRSCFFFGEAWSTSSPLPA